MSLPSSEGPAKRALLSNPAAGLSLPLGTDMPPSRPPAPCVWFRIPPHPPGHDAYGEQEREKRQRGDRRGRAQRGREGEKGLRPERRRDRRLRLVQRQAGPTGRVENEGGIEVRRAPRVRDQRQMERELATRGARQKCLGVDCWLVGS